MSNRLVEYTRDNRKEDKTMNVAIRYYSRGGNTKKLAEAISQETGVDALDTTHPIDQPCDLLFLASSVYAADIDKHLKEFLQSLNPQYVKRVINVSTSASGRTTVKNIKAILDEKGIEMDEQSFHCPGSFLLVHRNRPNENDLQNCREFVQMIIDQNL